MDKAIKIYENELGISVKSQVLAKKILKSMQEVEATLDKEMIDLMHLLTDYIEDLGHRMYILEMRINSYKYI